MSGVQERKRAHALFEASEGSDFLARFARETGVSLLAFLERLVHPDRVAATILGGSIPLGIATQASDIDVIVLIDAADALLRPSLDEVVYSAEYPADEAQLAAANIVAMIAHVEVDFMFVLYPRLRALSERLERGGVALTIEQLRLSSRIKTGWLLARGPRFDAGRAGVLEDNALELHTAVNSFVIGLKNLEDARAALADSLPLAAHLGRLAVERCFEAYFAAQGYAYLGNKWLRFLARHQETCPPGRREPLAHAVALAVPAMFPVLSQDLRVVERHLGDAARAISALRGLIEVDPAFKLAFKLCPQMYDPST